MQKIICFLSFIYFPHLRFYYEESSNRMYFNWLLRKLKTIGLDRYTISDSGLNGCRLKEDRFKWFLPY